MLAALVVAGLILILLLIRAGFFTTFSAALSLAAKVEGLQQDVQSLQFEWTDTLDKLLAREERWRKRYKSEVNRALDIPASTPAEGKAAIRARLSASRMAQG